MANTSKLKDITKRDLFAKHKHLSSIKSDDARVMKHCKHMITSIRTELERRES